MLDYIHLSQTTPCDEPCTQVGSEDYLRNARLEAHAYIDQLKRVLGSNPEGSFFKIVRCPHDFGTYLDIRFYYDNEDQTHVKYMDNVETGCDNWDEQSIKELTENNYDFITKVKALH